MHLVASYREEAGRRIVEYTDLRFRSPYRGSAFVFRVVLDGNGHTQSAGFAGP